MDASRATSLSPRHALRFADAAGVGLAALLLAAPAAAEPWTLGGDARYYQFLRADDPDGSRRDAELGIFRLKLEGRRGEALAAEAHGVISLTSPASPAAASIASGTTRRLLELERRLVHTEDVELRVEVDRLNVAWEQRGLRLTAGRQAITWGVSYFWPALDLFAPFPPERIDREYKPGVDALRLTLPLGSLSQLEAVAAGQGRDLQDDGSVGALARFNLGPADVGLMGGRFHGDTVAGGFVTANVRGTGLRGEVAFTESGEVFDRTIDRERFWRASAGLDRQLTPTLSLTAELAWNGFGTTDPERYPRVGAADRVRRGEVNSVGRSYAGASLGWQAHPLLLLTGTVLANLSDGSVLLLAHADWSLGDNLSLVLGGIFGIGPGLRSTGVPRSEYGAAPEVLYAAIKGYF